MALTRAILDLVQRFDWGHDAYKALRRESPELRCDFLDPSPESSVAH